MTGRGKRITHLTIAMGLLVILICGYALRDKALEQWYLWKLESGDEEDRKAAADRLGRMGTARAIPKLMQAMVEDRGIDPIPSMAKYYIDKLAILSASEERIASLLENPPRDKSAVSEGDLRLELHHLQLTINVSRKMMDMAANQVSQTLTANDYFKALAVLNATAGEAVMPYLMAELEKENWINRWISVKLLAELGPKAGDALPDLGRIRNDENPFVRREVEKALENIGPLQVDGTKTGPPGNP